MSAPAAPSDIALAGSPGAHNASIVWQNHGTPPDYSDYFGVQIERDINGGGWVLAADLGGYQQAFAESGLPDGSAISYRARAYNSFGEYSGYSSTFTFATPLLAATGVSPIASPASVALTWTRNAQNNTGVKIWRTDAGGVTFHLLYTGTAPDQVSCDDSAPALTPSQNYKYYIETYNALVSANSAEVNAFTDDPPNAPSLPTLLALSTTSLRAGWRDNADNELGFIVEWGTDGITFAGSATVGPNITSHDITGLISNTLYYVRIKATNASGSSAYSNIVSCSTLAAVAQPGLTVTPYGKGKFEFVIQDNSELEDAHEIEESADGSTGWTNIFDLAPNQTYALYGSYADGVTKYFRARARQGSGGGAAYSAYSAVASATTLAAPGAPTGPAASEYQDTWFRATWSRPAAQDEAKFEVRIYAEY